MSLPEALTTPLKLSSPTQPTARSHRVSGLSRQSQALRSISLEEVGRLNRRSQHCRFHRLTQTKSVISGLSQNCDRRVRTGELGLQAGMSMQSRLTRLKGCRV